MGIYKCMHASRLYVDVYACMRMHNVTTICVSVTCVRVFVRSTLVCLQLYTGRGGVLTLPLFVAKFTIHMNLFVPYP